jgi:hypothetical protein
MHTVLVTFLPDEKSDDVPYMDIEKFAVPPALGDFIVFGTSQRFEVVQVIHSFAKNEDNYCVTVTPHELPHAAILRSEESRDNRVSE